MTPAASRKGRESAAEEGGGFRGEAAFEGHEEVAAGFDVVAGSCVGVRSAM